VSGKNSAHLIKLTKGARDFSFLSFMIGKGRKKVVTKESSQEVEKNFISSKQFGGVKG